MNFLCPICASLAPLTRTPAGEPVYECSNAGCQKAVPVAFAASLQQAPEPRTTTVAVASGSVAGRVYQVRLLPNGQARCQCTASIYGRECKHVREARARV